MQGLLLALSDGSLGEPCPRGYGEARFPRLCGLLALFTSVEVLWAGHLHDSKDLVLLPMLHNVVWEKLHGVPDYASICWGEQHWVNVFDPWVNVSDPRLDHAW